MTISDGWIRDTLLQVVRQKNFSLMQDYHLHHSCLDEFLQTPFRSLICINFEIDSLNKSEPYRIVFDSSRVTSYAPVILTRYILLSFDKRTKQLGTKRFPSCLSLSAPPSPLIPISNIPLFLCWMINQFCKINRTRIAVAWALVFFCWSNLLVGALKDDRFLSLANVFAINIHNWRQSIG